MDVIIIATSGDYYDIYQDIKYAAKKILTICDLLNMLENGEEYEESNSIWNRWIL